MDIVLSKFFGFIGEIIHILLGGALGLFIYKEELKEMSQCERLVYCILSIVIGLYGGAAFVEWFNIDPASDTARFVAIVIAVFGLAIFGLCRDQLNKLFEKVIQRL